MHLSKLMIITKGGKDSPLRKNSEISDLKFYDRIDSGVPEADGAEKGLQDTDSEKSADSPENKDASSMGDTGN